jgi:nickel/cobalt transporter (NicO) family protein
MISILLSTITVSILHALIPSHWLPLISIAKNYNWTKKETLLVTLYMGAAHVASTIVLGIIIGVIGNSLHSNYEKLFEIIAPITLIAMGIFFIYRHYTHHHFHINAQNNNHISKTKIVISLVSMMFFSPCLEVESFFLSAGQFGIIQVFIIALLYAFISIFGMLLWMWIALKGIQKLNWHKIEHNAGLITGFVLILCGLFNYFVH